MAKLPKLIRTQPHVERRIHRALSEDRAKRSLRHQRLPLSQAGDCPRNLWGAMHAIPTESEPEGRVLTLFDLGSAVEDHMIRMLRSAGFEVVDRDRATGEQLRVVDCDGMASGRLDGLIADRGRPLPDPWQLLEIKSANAKQFEVLTSAGIEAWQPKYVAQAQVYMGLASRQLDYGPITDTLFVVECKDDSRIHAERVRFDANQFERLRRNVRDAILSPEPPARPSSATSQYCAFCKWCPRNQWCWGSTADVRFDS